MKVVMNEATLFLHSNPNFLLKHLTFNLKESWANIYCMLPPFFNFFFNHTLYKLYNVCNTNVRSWHFIYVLILILLEGRDWTFVLQTFPHLILPTHHIVLHNNICHFRPSKTSTFLYSMRKGPNQAK